MRKVRLVAISVLIPLLVLAADSGSYQMNGTVGKREVAVECQLKGATLTGTMRNKENGKEFQLQGVVNAGGNAKIRVTEGGKPSGVLNGTLTASGFTGTWKAVEGSKEMPCKLTGNFIAAAPPPPEPPAAVAPAKPAAPVRPKAKVYSGSVYKETIGGIKLFSTGSTILKKYGQPSQPPAVVFQDERGYSITIVYSSIGMQFGLMGDSPDVAKASIGEIKVTGSGIYTGSGAGIGTSLDELKKIYPKGNSSDGTYIVTDEEDCSPELTFNLSGNQVTQYSLMQYYCD